MSRATDAAIHAAKAAVVLWVRQQPDGAQILWANAAKETSVTMDRRARRWLTGALRAEGREYSLLDDRTGLRICNATDVSDTYVGKAVDRARALARFMVDHSAAALKRHGPRLNERDSRVLTAGGALGGALLNVCANRELTEAVISAPSLPQPSVAALVKVSK